MPTTLFNKKPDEADDELESLQRPALFVAGDPTNEHAPPSDGLEYLRRVRKQSQAMPAVVRADVDPSHVTANPVDVGACSSSASTPSTQGPSARWQQALLHDFAALQGRLPSWHTQARASGRSRTWPAPPKRDAAWQTYCFGEPATGKGDGGGEDGEDGSEGAVAGAAGVGSPPLLSAVLQLDQRRAAALLALLLRRLQREGGPSRALSLWLFAAMSRLERGALDADTSATLRALVRTCLALRTELPAAAAPADGTVDAAAVADSSAEDGTAADAEGAADNTAQRAAALNVLLGLAGAFFGQASADELQASALDEVPSCMRGGGGRGLDSSSSQQRHASAAATRGASEVKLEDSSLIYSDEGEQ